MEPPSSPASKAASDVQSAGKPSANAHVPDNCDKTKKKQPSRDLVEHFALAGHGMHHARREHKEAAGKSHLRVLSSRAMPQQAASKAHSAGHARDARPGHQWESEAAMDPVCT